MEIQGTGKITRAVLIFEKEDLEAFSYWYGNRFDKDPKERTKWERGQELALRISILEHKSIGYADKF